MILVPRKKIITSRFRQRGNIVSFVDPSPPPPSDQKSALEYILSELSNASPGGAGTPRLDMQWRPDGLRVFTCKQSAEIAQNDVSPAWGITGSPSDWSNLVSTINFGNLRSIWWSQDGTRLSRCARVPSFNSNITVHDQSATPFDLSVLGSSVTQNFPVFPALSGGPADHVWSEDGLLFWLHYVSSPDKLYEFSVTVPFDITTLVTPQNKDFDFGPDANFGIKTFEFANEGTFLFAMDGQFLVSWNLPTPFDISTATNFQTGPEVPAANLGIPRGLAARSDNTDLSVQGDQNQRRIAWLRVPPPPLLLDPDIDEYTLTAADINFTIAGNNHLTPWFNIAGDRVYFSRSTSWETWQYSMSPPGNLASTNFELTHQWGFNTQFQRGMAFTPDRSKVYKIRRSSSSDDFFISADPFSVTEMGEVAGGNPEVLTGVSAQGGVGSTPATPNSFVVTPDNLNIFVQSADIADRAIYHHQMSIAGDAGTAVFQGQVIDASSEFATQLFGIIYSPSGDKLFVLGDDGGTVRIAQYDLNPVFDVTTAVFSGKQITVTPLNNTLLSLFVWANPLTPGDFNLYLTWPTGGASNGSSWQYDLYQVFGTPPTAPIITAFSAASYSGDISASSVDPNGVFVDESGTRLFVVNGSPGNDLNSYSLSVPFDLTTISAVIASEAIVTSPIGVFLNPDGTKLFVTTFGSNIGVQEFPLSVPWDITTKGAMTLLSTPGDGATIPFGLHFSGDGLNVYTSDNGGKVYQWSLASAFDVSAPTFIGSFDFTSEIVATKGQDLALSSDGTKMYISDLNVGTDSEIFQYSLITPFNITTAVFDSVFLTLTGRIGVSGWHMMNTNDRLYVAYNGDVGGADPEAVEEFIIP